MAESTNGLSSGDPIAAQGTMTVAQNFSHNKANEITYVWPPGETNPAYDGAGNMTLIPVILGAQTAQRELTWDAWNRLVKIEEDGMASGQYAYDGFTRRATKDLGVGPIGIAQFYYSDQWQVLEERVFTYTRASRTFRGIPIRPDRGNHVPLVMRAYNRELSTSRQIKSSM